MAHAAFMKNLAIIGGGSWGTALAIVLAPRFDCVRLWVYEQELADRMCATGINDVYLPGFQLSKNVGILNDLGSTIDGAGIVLSVVPSHLVRALYQQMLPTSHPPCTS